MTALTILGNINYAINDWGISEAFEEGWIDELYKEYNEDLDAWINALKTEVDKNTPEGAECVKAAEMIKDALYNKVKFVMECPECDGYGELGYGENEHGCGYCGGDGYVETDEYDQVDFKNNNLWAEKWNKEYCQAINDDLIQTFFDNEGNVKVDINKDERTTTKINENQKVTLTFGQLKRLARESSSIENTGGFLKGPIGESMDDSYESQINEIKSAYREYEKAMQAMPYAKDRKEWDQINDLRYDFIRAVAHAIGEIAI